MYLHCNTPLAIPLKWIPMSKVETILFKYYDLKAFAELNFSGKFFFFYKCKLTLEFKTKRLRCPVGAF